MRRQCTGLMSTHCLAGMWRHECSWSLVEKHRVRELNVLSSACHAALAATCPCVALETALETVRAV